MKKKPLLAAILSVFSLALFLTGCTSLNYVDDDFDETKVSTVQTNEMFNISTYMKTSGNQTVKMGISQTPLEGAMVLFVQIKNNSDMLYRFNVEDIYVESPIGEISFITPSSYIEAYQNYEAQNYAGLMAAGTQLNSFANIQNPYRQTLTQPNAAIENQNKTPELKQLEQTIAGIQKHTTTTTGYINPYSEEYYYIFIRKPEEYPITVKYKDLIYKFGSKRDEAKEQ